MKAKKKNPVTREELIGLAVIVLALVAWSWGR